ncbi:MAG: hypothetical protein AAF944_28555 [Bacteroidota bacterium]
MRNRIIYTLPSILGLVVFMLSCQEDEEPITPPVDSDTTIVDSTVAISIDLKGYVQKGPFINGTTITVAELDSLLSPVVYLK